MILAAVSHDALQTFMVAYVASVVTYVAGIVALMFLRQRDSR